LLTLYAMGVASEVTECAARLVHTMSVCGPEGVERRKGVNAFAVLRC
jgi:hypothetical protein